MSQLPSTGLLKESERMREMADTPSRGNHMSIASGLNLYLLRARSRNQPSMCLYSVYQAAHQRAVRVTALATTHSHTSVCPVQVRHPTLNGISNTSVTLWWGVLGQNCRVGLHVATRERAQRYMCDTDILITVPICSPGTEVMAVQDDQEK